MLKYGPDSVDGAGHEFSKNCGQSRAQQASGTLEHHGNRLQD